jgi:putative nucleotidyltransferase with HDIG domain
MIPSESACRKLWDKYGVPENKRRHLELVAKVAVYLAQRLQKAGCRWQINTSLVVAAALLHDLDKNVEKLPGEQHPDAAVRILRQEGMPEVADLVKTHPLHLILNPATAPKTGEEKILFLSDKMVKYDIITVDERFALWDREPMDPQAKKILKATYPLVKNLEKELCTLIKVAPEAVKNEALKAEY